MVIYFCPACGAYSSVRGDRCEACGAALDEGPRDLVLGYIGALRHPEPTVALVACAMLAQLGDRRAIEPLIALIEARPQSFDVLCEAVGALTTFACEEAVPVLRKLLQDEEAVVPARVAALQALMGLGGEIAAEARMWAIGCDRPSLRSAARELSVPRKDGAQ